MQRLSLPMRAWYGALRNWIVASRCRTIIVVGVVLAVMAGALGAMFGLAVATFAVVVYTAVFAAVTMLGVTPLRALPAFEVGLWVDGELRSSFTHSTDRLRAPIDTDACVQNDVNAIRREIPSPAPRRPWPASGLGYTGLTDLRETQDEAVKRLQSELQTYAAELRKWLEAFDSRRRFAHQLIRRPIAIHNGGETAAEGITLRLHLPEGLIPMTPDRIRQFNVGSPPERPKYEQRSALRATNIALAQAATAIRPSMPDFSKLASDSSRPALVRTREQSHDVAEVRLPALTHGLTESTTEPLEILAREPGTYEITWDAHVANLPRPVRGTITIVVAAMPEGGEPLTRVELVVLSGDVEIVGVSPARP